MDSAMREWPLSVKNYKEEKFQKNYKEKDQ